jgi:2-keto-3-deoxy-L-rhamnonate aldolase RhmA
MSRETSPVTPHSRKATVRRLLSLTAVIMSALITSVALTQQPQKEAIPEKPTEGKPVQEQPKGPMAPPALPGSLSFNTVITKLKAGKQVFSNTITDPNLEGAKKACVDQDFIWIEMQHSTLTWRETQQLIKVIAEAGCIPFVRVPSANIGDILKACDAGALGIVVPMVESVEEARNAVLFSKYPIGHRDYPNTKPWGRRSSGGNQATSLWGKGYPTNANNNILVMIQIESPVGVGMIDNILNEVEGIDIVMVASNDFGLFGGDRDGSPSYNAREKLVRESVLAHGKVLAGPSSWRNRPGYTLFQGPKTAKTSGYEKN